MHIKHIHCMIEDLAEYGKCMIEAGTGEGNVNLCDAGQIVDMIKDLADAEYHSLISKEMKKYEEEEEEEEKYLLRMLKEEHKDDYKRYMEEYGDDGEKRFYDNYRHADGRFARKGTGMYMPRSSGRRRGYVEPPYWHMMPEMYEHDPEYWRDVDREKGRLYYTPMNTSGAMNNADGKTYSDGVNDGTRKGYSDGYEKGMMDGKKSGSSRYDRARRGYEETKEMHKGNDPESKRLNMQEMEKVLNVVFDEIDEMMEDASPEIKNMVKTKGMSRFQKIQ